MKRRIYDPPENFERANFLEALARVFIISNIDNIKGSFYFYDSFDWRLFNLNRTLCAQNGNYIVYKNEMRNQEFVIPFKKRKKYIHPRDFPDSSMKVFLKNILDHRALIKLVNARSRQSVLTIVNPAGNTVAVINLQNFSAEKNILVDRIIIDFSSKSSPEEINTLDSFIKGFGFHQDKNPLPFWKIIISRLSQRPPGKYSPKINIHLKKEYNLREAHTDILKSLFKTAEENIPGLLDDVDTEFLHDFRVSLRRIRTALSQIKGDFPKSETRFFKSAFSRIAEKTNLTRDLDVYLLKEDIYRQGLPQELQKGLDTFFDKIRAKRAEAFKKIKSELKSAYFKGITEKWKHFLDNAFHIPYMKNSDYNAKRKAAEFIKKRYFHILKKGSEINRKSEDREFHKLRIQCKKLRYIMEFFSSLFDSGKYEKLISKLKKLQTNLGNFNDFRVQISELKNELESIDFKKKKTICQAAALGAFMEKLHIEKERQRNEFWEIFNSFTSETNQKVFKNL